jgi:hypothetical protein
MGANKISWANMIILENDCMSFFPNFFSSYEWILEQFVLQLVIMNVYSFQSTWHFKKIILE